MAASDAKDVESIFYRPGDPLPSPLSKDPFKSLIAPRPIGWISTLHPTKGANLAPYSQFFQLTFSPPYVAFSANQTPFNERKDSTVNAELTGKFAWSSADWDLRNEVNATSEWLDHGVDEFEKAGLEKEWGKVVNVPMVKRSKLKFECEYYTTLRLPGHPPLGSVDIVIGRVVGIHIDPRVLSGVLSGETSYSVETPVCPFVPDQLDGTIDYSILRPIARLGGNKYCVVSSGPLPGAGGNVFTMDMPVSKKEKDAKAGSLISNAMNAGLQGQSDYNRRLGQEQETEKAPPAS